MPKVGQRHVLIAVDLVDQAYVPLAHALAAVGPVMAGVADLDPQACLIGVKHRAILIVDEEVGLHAFPRHHEGIDLALGPQ